MYLLCQNKVENYQRWRQIFDSEANAQRDAGLKLEYIWRDINEQNSVFFLFSVENFESAKAFLNAPITKEQAKRSGVIDGEYYFL